MYKSLIIETRRAEELDSALAEWTEQGYHVEHVSSVAFYSTSDGKIHIVTILMKQD